MRPGGPERHTGLVAAAAAGSRAGVQQPGWRGAAAQCPAAGPRRRTLRAGSGQTGRFVDPAGGVRADGASHLPKSVTRVPQAHALTRARLEPTPQERNGPRGSAGPAQQQSRAGSVGSAPTPGWASPVTPHAQHARGLVPIRWTGRPPPHVPPPAGARGQCSILPKASAPDTKEFPIHLSC